MKNYKKLGFFLFFSISILINVYSQNINNSPAEVRVNLGHSSSPNLVKISPDGKYLMSWGGDKSILWDYRNTGASIREHVHDSGGGSVIIEFSPDSSMYYLGGGKISSLINLQTGNEVKLEGPMDRTFSAKFSYDNRYLIVTGVIFKGQKQSWVRIYSTATGQMIKDFNFWNTHEVIDCDHDGNFLLAYHLHGNTYLERWSKDTFTANEYKTIDGIEIYPKVGNFSKIIGTERQENPYTHYVGVWDLNTNTWTRLEDIGGAGALSISEIIHSQDGDYVFYEGSTLRLPGLKRYNLTTNKLYRVKTDDPHSNTYDSNIYFRCYDKYQNYLITKSRTNEIKFWNRSNGHQEGSLGGITMQNIYDVNFSDDGKSILIGQRDVEWEFSADSMQLISRNADAQVQTHRKPGINDYSAITGDGRYEVFKSFSNDTIEVLDTATGRLLWKKENIKGRIFVHPEINRLVYKEYQSGQHINKYRMIDVATGNSLPYSLNTPGNDAIFSMSSDGKYLFWGSDSNASDHSLYCNDFLTGDLIWRYSFSKSQFSSQFQTIDGTAFSERTGEMVLFVRDIGFTVLETATGRIKREFERYHWISYGELSPDGSKLVFRTHSSGLVELMNIQTGEDLSYTFTQQSGDWLTWTPEGYFQGSDSIARNDIYVVEGVNCYPIDSFFEKYNRPDIVAAIIQGKEYQQYQNASIQDGISLPPRVTVEVKNENGAYITPGNLFSVPGSFKGQLELKVTAVDQGGGIDNMLLYLNNKALERNVRGLQRSAASGSVVEYFTISLANGDNTVSAVAFSSERTQSIPAAFTARYQSSSSGKPDLYAVILGANSYKNPRYNLNYALADAKAFETSIRQASSTLFGNVRITSLYEQNLTRENVIRMLDQVTSSSKPDDVFVLYYAGHGIAMEDEGKNSFYFVLPEVTQMTRTDNILSHGLSSAEFRERLSAIPATKQMILVDACNSGAFAEGFAVRGAAEEIALKQLARASGSVILTATNDEQFASEVAQLGHGVFTYALIQGISGEAATRDGRITASSLRLYIDEAVPNLSERYKSSIQFPTTFMFGNDFPLGIKAR